MNFHLLSLHSRLLALVIAMMSITIVFAASIGEVQPYSEFDWTDAIGEGGITFITLVWIFFTLISRPAGRVTVLLVVGLLFMHVSMLLDFLDEIFQYPDNHAWLTAYESIPAPIGMVLMTIGLFHWHKEQLSVNQQLKGRERIYREHGLMDYITGLYSAEYMKQQVRQELHQLKEGGAQFCLMMLDIDQFDAFNRQYGDVRGDQFLREISELMMYELRPTDLASRYAGDRFIILLPHTNFASASELSKRMESALQERQFRPLEEESEFHCHVSICVTPANPSTTEEGLIAELNQQMEALKLKKHNRQAA